MEFNITLPSSLRYSLLALPHSMPLSLRFSKQVASRRTADRFGSRLGPIESPVVKTHVLDGVAVVLALVSLRRV